MTVCAIKLCHNTSEKQKKCNNITFHRIPVDPVTADKWVKNIRLNRGEVHWKPTKNTRICSKHFNNEDMYITPSGLCKLRRNAVPDKDLHVSCTDTDDQLEVKLNVDEISPSQRVSSSNDPENMKESVFETSNTNLIIECSLQSSMSRGKFRRPSENEFDYTDTPSKVFLRNKLNKSSSLNIKYRKIIKTLKQKTSRLQRRNKSLKGIILRLRRIGMHGEEAFAQLWDTKG